VFLPIWTGNTVVDMQLLSVCFIIESLLFNVLAGAWAVVAPVDYLKTAYRFLLFDTAETARLPAFAFFVRLFGFFSVALGWLYILVMVVAPAPRRLRIATQLILLTIDLLIIGALQTSDPASLARIGVFYQLLGTMVAIAVFRVWAISKLADAPQTPNPSKVE